MKNRRKGLGFSAEYVANCLGVSPATIYRYEKGDIEKVPGDILEPLARVLHTTPAYIMGWESTDDEDEAPAPAIMLSDRASRVGYLYDRADARDQKLVDTVLEPYDDGTVSPQTLPSKAVQLHALVKHREEDGFNELTVYEEPTAAGFGNYLSSSPAEHTEQYPDGIIPRGTNYGVPISGNSMEPKFHNGSTAFVQSVPVIDDGEIGLFSLNGSSYIKQLVVDRANGSVRLHSLNPIYPDIEIHEGDYLYTFGRVLGSYPK